MHRLIHTPHKLAVSLTLAVAIWAAAAPSAYACYLIIRTCTTTHTYLFGIWEIAEPVTTCTERKEPC
jgi:hypothetical protein